MADKLGELAGNMFGLIDGLRANGAYALPPKKSIRSLKLQAERVDCCGGVAIGAGAAGDAIGRPAIAPAI